MKGNPHLWGTQEQMSAIHVNTCKWSEHVLNLLCDCVVNVNVWSSKWDERRGFCSYSNNSVPQRIWGSCERTSLNISFEVAIKMQDVPVCVRAFFMGVCDLGYVFSSGLGIMESSLFFFFLLLCLASCSHHLAPGFENQAKSLPPEWHENIPAYTQPSCRSLSLSLSLSPSL